MLVFYYKSLLENIKNNLKILLCSYKQRMQEMLDDEDMIDSQKYAKIIKDQEAHNEKILEVTRFTSP